MVFVNRDDAGRRLAERLLEYKGRNDVIVLGIPRGGVPIAFQIATRLEVPLDIFLSRKLGVPGNEELAFGAVAAGDGRYLDDKIVRMAGISEEEIEQISQRVRRILDERSTLYRGGRSPVDVKGQVVILVDDGIATGASSVASIHALRQMKPAKIVLAVPVLPASTRAWLEMQVEELVCLYAPEDFYAVGQFYREFNQVDDQTVITLLEEARKSAPKPPRPHVRNIQVEEVAIAFDNISLSGTLSVPEDATGLVLFAHGSGSSRHSPRNHSVAQVLQSRGLATLLFDLLTTSEERIDQQTSQYRFDIGFLAERLAGATRWIRRLPAMRDLRIGYFGASTGAAAALVAAAEMPDEISSVVSRGGRPDLAGQYLARVKAPVLLIVGGKDHTVLELNRKALRELSCIDKQLVIISGATHLFEEQGALEEAAYKAAEWFERTLKHPRASSHSTTVTV